MLSLLVACNTETPNESSVVPNESSTVIPNESSEIPNESSDITDESSQPDGIPQFDINNVVYYDAPRFQLLIEDYVNLTGLREIFSDISPYSLLDALKNESYSKDTYYFVGINFNTDDRSKYEPFSKGEQYLANIGFVPAEEYPWEIGSIAESYIKMTGDEQTVLRRERLELMVGKEYADEIDRTIIYMYTAGYIHSSAIEKLIDNNEFGVEITWLPHPDNVQIWLDTDKYA